MAKGDIVVGLDIGTTKVATVIAEIAHEGGRVNILGVGTAASQGIRRGVVTDIEHTVGAIIESRDKAQRMAGAEIHSAVVGVTGEHIASLNHKGVVAITHTDRQVTDEDVARVMENARVIVLPPDRDIIHQIPRGFTLDGHNGIRSPVGMSGTRLEVETHIVTGATTFLRNVATCVERAGLHIEDMVLEPIATADSVLMYAEKELGVALVDIGGGTSDIAIFQNGDICWTAVVPVGGAYVTRDIAAGLRASLEEAERVKLEHGTALLTGLSPDASFTYKHVGSDQESTATVGQLAAIIEPRMSELFSLVRAELNRSNLAHRLPAGMVISGGGAMLTGARDLAGSILDLPVRIGFPSGVGGLAESVSAPTFATAVGLVQWGGRLHAGAGRREANGSFLAAFREWIRRVLRLS